MATRAQIASSLVWTPRYCSSSYWFHSFCLHQCWHFQEWKTFQRMTEISIFCVFTLSFCHLFLFKPVQVHLLREDRNNNNHWQEKTVELGFRSCWPWQKVRSVQLIFTMFKGSWRTLSAVGLRLTVLSTGVRRRYAAVFFMSWAGGYTWSCTHSQLPHFLRKKLLLFYRPGLRRSLPISNNFLKRSPSSNRYCAPVEMWNELCCGSLVIYIRQRLFI